MGTGFILLVMVIAFWVFYKFVRVLFTNTACKSAHEPSQPIENKKPKSGLDGEDLMVAAVTLSILD